MKEKEEVILNYLESNYSSFENREFLHFDNPFECLCAIILSAQTTDKSVNKVTPILFSHFPDAKSMAEAELPSIEDDIHSLGLYKNKAKHLKELSMALINEYGGEIPSDKEKLKRLPGVGEKTSGVYLLEQGIERYIPVDTHVKRVSYRLGYAKEDESPSKIEKKLEKAFPIDKWKLVHKGLILFGRNVCHAQKPECESCELKPYCCLMKSSSTKGR